MSRPSLCLPPLSEGGQRLHPASGTGVYWLQLALRQHEVCWRVPEVPDEKRIFLFGNSAIFGFPHPVELTFGALLNQRFEANRVPAHLFNLGWVFTYMLRDALILHESLRYQPDLIVYPLTLDDFIHYAPAVFPPQLVYFFESNADALARFAADPPPGLAEPLALYRGVIERQQRFGRLPFEHLREIGTFARVLAHNNATAIANEWAYLPAAEQSQRHQRTRYDCNETIKRVAKFLTDWSDWNVLGYLEQVHNRGIDVLVINWPSPYEPVGDCYNVRYTNSAQEHFNAWMAEQTRARGLPYLDLHDSLEPDYFVDSLHLSPEGHSRIAEALLPKLSNQLRDEPPQRDP